MTQCSESNRKEAANLREIECRGAITFTGIQLLLAWYAFRLDRESPWVLWAMPVQQFVYRQMMYLVVIESVQTAIQGSRLHWRPIDRRGEVEVEVTRPS